LGGIAKQNGITSKIRSNVTGPEPFQQEYLAFLKRHELSFDDKYLWD
jgi:hypothetical protein